MTNNVSTYNPKWYAIYTKYKTEKYVQNLLTRKGLTCYVPILKRVKRYKRKIVRQEIPMINCYVFVCIEDSERARVLETEYVYKFIGVKGKPLVIPNEEIKVLKQVAGDITLDVNAQPSEWQEGSYVEVISGNLTGLKGKLISKVGKNHFIVSLVTLGYDLEMEIDVAYLSKIDKVA